MALLEFYAAVLTSQKQLAHSLRARPWTSSGALAQDLSILRPEVLTFVRTIGRLDVPYRVAALAGFTSYSVGHNIGASVFTGGAVRYRIYSAWGLTAVEVAKICFVAGLTFWLGKAAVLGLGIAAVPQAASAIDQLPMWFNPFSPFNCQERICRMGKIST